MEIKAFRGLRFDSSVVGDLGSCISPPYDVIDMDLQQKLYDKSEYNVVRIIKGKTAATDTAGDNQYTRAAGLLESWIDQGALKPALEPALYAYVQDFGIGSNHFQRSGFAALGKLEEFGNNVQPHEKTLDGPKSDRLQLMSATEAQLGQIFMLYDDPEKIADAVMDKVSAKQSLIDFTDDSKVRHRLFGIDEQTDIEAIVKMLAAKQVIIADGHHRYETALNYYNQTQNPAAWYRMMTFVNMKNEGLIILPTHRLVANLSDFDFDKLLTELYDDFDIVAHPFVGDDDKALAMQRMFEQMKGDFEDNRNAFGVYAANKAFYVVTLKDVAAMDSVTPKISQAAKELDVNVLHKLILEKILGIGEKQLACQSNIEYIKDIGDAVDKSIEKVDTQKSQAVFFMNPTRIGQVKAIAAAGEKMPQKSTFFYPKIHTGLVINKL